MDVKDIFDKSLFLLGAGASYDAGCKLSGGMLKALEGMIGNSTDDNFTKPEKETLSFLLSCLEYHGKWRTLESNQFQFYPNIEELALLLRRIKNRESFLPYPITGNWSDKLVKLEAEFQSLNNGFGTSGLYGKIEKTIRSKLLLEWLKFDMESLNYLNPIKEFLESYPSDKFRIDMFSLNYDLVVEEFFNAINSRPFRGFVSGQWRGFDESVQDDFGRVDLYKLHGSLDWVRLESGELKEKESLTEEEQLEVAHQPYIIFGQGTKTFSVEPFFSLINTLKNKLTEKSYYFIIGYSFFDPYINNLLLEAVRGTSKKIIIINPFFGPDSIKDAQKDVNSCEALLDNEKKLELGRYIEQIQKNSFYSELPEFNNSRVNAESIIYIPLGTKDFMQNYFSDKGNRLFSLIERFEKQREQTELPF